MNNNIFAKLNKLFSLPLKFSQQKGYGGEDNPKFVFPSIAGTIDDSLEMELEDISRVKRILVGEKATRIRKDNLEISDITWNGVCTKKKKKKMLILINDNIYML